MPGHKCILQEDEVPKWTAGVIKNCLQHKLGQEVLEVTSPQIPDLNIIEPVCDYAETEGFQEA